MGLRNLLFPPQQRRLPHGRWWNIAARTIHLAAMGSVLGGHVFGVEADRIWPFLLVTIVSGGALVAIELYPTADWLHQGCALAVFAKLGVLLLVPLFWDARVALLLVVLAIGSVGSHAPRTIRHYSVLRRRVMVD